MNNYFQISHHLTSQVNFEPSFVGMGQILIEIRLFKHEFENRNFGQLEILGDIKFANKLFTYFFLHFIRIFN